MSTDTEDRRPDARLTPEQLDAFGAELDAIRQRVIADLGERDANYIRRVIKAQRGLEVGGRGLLCSAAFPPAWLAGTAALSLSKILDNMEIGHNVMHGQYDWMNDPELSEQGLRVGHRLPGRPVAPLPQLHAPHPHQHRRQGPRHRLRRAAHVRGPAWRPYYLGNPLYATLLALLFQYGRRAPRRRSRADRGPARRPGATSAQMLRGDLAEGPPPDAQGLRALPGAVRPVASCSPWPATLTANLVRNLWSFTIIFCGHFPEGTQEFTEEETEDETRGQWYFRQLLGSANLEGGRPSTSSSGNLSHQIEHHLFPDLPANRYAEISVEVREICERYGVPYNIGPLGKQFGSVVKKICRLALPDRRGRNQATSPSEGAGDEVRTPIAA